MAKGEIQPDGTFVLGTYSDSDGAKVGSHPVTILPPPAMEGAPISAVAKSLPKKYTVASTSGITVEVEPGKGNTLLVELTSQ
ncbi:hypothetical protein MalM25_16620 [Planctomycetes bacterium MalM25]|nr:hypothetical protein MalM25_16620 [Planctomycetes bacterium MalM25]